MDHSSGNSGGGGRGQNNNNNNPLAPQERRITNCFQPGHKFLEQLSNGQKSPMSLVNELCRTHHLKSEYALLNITGPQHSKVFHVCLKLGDYEQFFGDGSSVKNAQREAAINALANTRFLFPSTKISDNRNLSALFQTPMSELNTLLMKKGIQAKYELTLEKIPVENNGSNSNSSVTTINGYGSGNNNNNNNDSKQTNHRRGIQSRGLLPTPQQSPISSPPQSCHGKSMKLINVNNDPTKTTYPLMNCYRPIMEQNIVYPQYGAGAGGGYVPYVNPYYYWPPPLPPPPPPPQGGGYLNNLQIYHPGLIMPIAGQYYPVSSSSLSSSMESFGGVGGGGGGGAPLLSSHHHAAAAAHQYGSYGITNGNYYYGNIHPTTTYCNTLAFPKSTTGGGGGRGGHIQGVHHHINGLLTTPPPPPQPQRHSSRYKTPQIKQTDANNRINFEAKVELDGQKFTGQGRTAQSARHSAAQVALNYVKYQATQQDDSGGGGGSDLTSSSTTGGGGGSGSGSGSDRTSSPVSLVYEHAAKLGYKVLFELVHQEGLKHMPTFLMRCALYTTEPKEPFVVTYGEDRSKKLAKKVVAAKMLDTLKEKQLVGVGVEKEQQQQQQQEEKEAVMMELDNTPTDTTNNNEKNPMRILARPKSSTETATKTSKSTEEASADTNNLQQKPTKTMTTTTTNNHQSLVVNNESLLNTNNSSSIDEQTSSSSPSPSSPPSTSTSPNCRHTSQLYRIARNLNIGDPAYHWQTLDQKSFLYKKFLQFTTTTKPLNQATSSSSSKSSSSPQSQSQQSQPQQQPITMLLLYKVDCTLVFEQKLPQELHCTIVSFGFGTSVRMAKSIASYICLLKLGQMVSFDEAQPNEEMNQCLLFSIEHQQQQQQHNDDGGEDGDANLFNDSSLPSSPSTLTLTIPATNVVMVDNDKNVKNDDYNHLKPSLLNTIEENVHFLTHVLGKMYLFALKNSTKRIDNLFGKLENYLRTFYHTEYGTTTSTMVISSPSSSDTTAATTATNVVVEHKCDRIKLALNQWNGNKYWDHLGLLSSLLTIGLSDDEHREMMSSAAVDEENEMEKQQVNTCLLLRFESHITVSETANKQQKKMNNATPTTKQPQYICIISGHCHPLLTQVLKFDLVKKNFVNFGLGYSEDNAREVASFWTLKHLSYQARKQIIESEFDIEIFQKNRHHGRQQQQQNHNQPQHQNQHQTQNSEKKKGSKTKKLASFALISKRVIAQLHLVCRDLHSRLPQFEQLDKLAKTTTKTTTIQQQIVDDNDGDDHDQQLTTTTIPTTTTTTTTSGKCNNNNSTNELISVKCSLVFVQKIPHSFTGKLVSHAIAPSHRMARTISAYLTLLQLGVDVSMFRTELSTMDTFNTYLQQSQQQKQPQPQQQCNKNSPKTTPTTTTIPTSSSSPPPPTPLLSPPSIQNLESNSKELTRNVEFIIRILQDIYRPFLRHNKMTIPPASILTRIEEELFEYHNHQQQVMDQSTTFDRCSANVRLAVRQLVHQFDCRYFWHHLLLLSTILSTLTNYLGQPPLVPLVYEFQCNVCACDDGEGGGEGDVKEDDGEDVVVNDKADDHDHDHDGDSTIEPIEKNVIQDNNAAADNHDHDHDDYQHQENIRKNSTTTKTPTPTSPPLLATISVHSRLPVSVDTHGLASKSYIAFGLSSNESYARELASYRALRHLAINLWK